MLLSRYTFSIDLREPPKNGEAQIVFRCREEDRLVVSAAAKLLGISVNKLMRALVILSAKEIIKQNGKPNEPPRAIDEEEIGIRVSVGDLPPGMKR